MPTSDTDHPVPEGEDIVAIGYDGMFSETRVPFVDADSLVDRSRNLGIGENGAIVRIDHGPFVAASVELKNANIGSLAIALTGNYLGSELYVDLSTPPVNDDILDLDTRYHLDIREDRLVAVVSQRHPRQPALPAPEIADSVMGVAAAYGCAVAGVSFTLAGGGTPEEMVIDLSGSGIDPKHAAQLQANDREVLAGMAHDVHIELTAEPEQMVGTLMEGAAALGDFLAATRDGPLNAEGVLNLLRGGHYAVLIGEVESSFLEVKTTLHPVWASGSAGERAKIEFAQDVARFANGDTDAILVAGYRESAAGGRPQIGAITPISDARIDLTQLAEILDARIVPPLTGLTLEAFPVANDESLVAIYVPRQPVEMQPYLVHGAVVGDRVEGAFFSIVQRRGEGSIVTSAQQIHAYIVAGKRYLRGDP